MWACCERLHSTVVRICVLSHLGAGIALLAFGCSLEMPIEHFPPIAFIILGGLSLLAVPLGAAGSFRKKYWQALLIAFLVIGGLATVLQIVLVGFLFGDRAKVTSAIVDNGASMEYKNVDRILSRSQGACLFFVVFQIISFAWTVFLLVYFPDDPYGKYGNFDEESNEVRALALTTLRSDITKNQSSKGTMDKTYDRIRERMAQKYGHLSHTTDWGKKRGFFG